MKTAVVLSVLLSLVVAASSSKAALIDPRLEGFARGEQGSQLQRVLVLLNPSVSLASLPKPTRYNREAVLSYYKEVSRQSSISILQDISNRKITGVKITELFWINSSFVAEVTPLGLKQLAEHATVSKIYLNGKMGQDPVRDRGPRSPVVGNDNYSITTLGLDRLFKEKPAINGQGVIVGAVDTGVDGSHPALANKIVSFWNGQTGSTTPPKDFDRHGTHVSGTIVGGDRDKNWIGVAPGAKLAMAGALINYDSMLKGMQWFLDIQNNPQVGRKIKAVSCSWNTGGAPDQEVFYRAIAAWEAAGILPVFSAGNAGPNPSSITPPHEYPGTFAVAAYGPDGKIADFSSRGPGVYHNQPTQKPDLAAPGVSINSSLPGGKYGKLDGTSMATPHVTGTVALMLQVNPNLNPAQMKQIILKTLTHPSSTVAGQWLPDWGFGQLNAYAAVMGTAQFSNFINQQQSLTSLPLFASPADLDMSATALASLGEVGSGADVYQNTDSAAWVQSSQIY